MSPNDRKLIAVIGATGQQGGGVVRALQASSQFKVRALSRNPGKHRELADEVALADLNRPETLTLKLHLKRHMASFWSPIFGKKAPTSLSRQRRRYALPRMPVINTLSGQRCLM